MLGKLKSSWTLRFQNNSSVSRVEKKRFVDPKRRRSGTGITENKLSRITSTGMLVMHDMIVIDSLKACDPYF
jgi:hypothetical protein